MKERSIPFHQHLYHDDFDEEESQKYLVKTFPIIGKIVVYFNGLESELDSMICEIIHDRTDAFGLIVLHKLNYSSKVDLFKRFNDDLFLNTEIQVSEYDEVIKNLKECGRLRNLVVHAEWENTDMDGFTYVKLRINKNGMHQEYVQFSEASLNKIENLILETRAKLESFWDERNEKLYGNS